MRKGKLPTFTRFCRIKIICRIEMNNMDDEKNLKAVIALSI